MDNKLFNLSKNSKEDAPLDGLVYFYAYKTEERKYNLRYPSIFDHEDRTGELKLTNNE